MRIRAGKNRQPWRIREFLDGRGLSMADVGREIGVAKHIMSETVRGIRNHRRVLSKLRELGCPEKFLDLPEDLKTREVA
jgi:transcriptional regulator with XRE-family HTH domain